MVWVKFINLWKDELEQQEVGRFTKANLIPDKHICKLRNGSLAPVHSDMVGSIPLAFFSDNLKNQTSDPNRDIVEVFEIGPSVWKREDNTAKRRELEEKIDMMEKAIEGLRKELESL